MKTKRRNLKKTQKIRKIQKEQNGGIRILNNATGDAAFKYFIENSTFSYYGRGFFGILILAKLNDGITSPYRNIRTNGIGYVKYLLLKFFELVPSENPDIKNVVSFDIQREVIIQQNIYINSLKNANTLLEPICPCIVYSHSEPLEQSYKNSFYKIISQSIKNNRQIDRLFKGDVAFFAMEFMKNYSPLSKYINTFAESLSFDKALYTLDKVHQLGFMHNDFHNDNVLLVNNYNYFGFEKNISNGRAIIIDFGLATQFKYPEKIDDKLRIKLLQQECKYAHHGLLFSFKNMDSQHKIVQDKYISIFEKYYKCDIYQIINSYNLYIGGNMSIPELKLTANNKNIPKYPTKISLSLADLAEEELKTLNPESYDELINSINGTLEEEKRNPGYINALFANQFDNLLDPVFRIPLDNDPTKLRLEMGKK
jgi:serine/threonine protein kinase